jgi:hypothetical protein
MLIAMMFCRGLFWSYEKFGDFIGQKCDFLKKSHFCMGSLMPEVLQ